jgi:hypothetical protein
MSVHERVTNQGKTMLRFQLLEEVHGTDGMGNPVDLPPQKLVRKPKQETTSVVTL